MNKKEIFVVLGESVVRCTFLGISQHDPKYYVIQIKERKLFKQKYFCFDSEIEALEYLIEKLNDSMNKAIERKNKIIEEKLLTLNR